MPTPEERDNMVVSPLISVTSDQHTGPASHPLDSEFGERIREFARHLIRRNEAIAATRRLAPNLPDAEVERILGETIRERAVESARETLENLQEAARRLETLPDPPRQVVLDTMNEVIQRAVRGDTLQDYTDAEIERVRVQRMNQPLPPYTNEEAPIFPLDLVISEETARRDALWLEEQNDEVLSDLIITHVFNGVGAGTTGYSTEMEMAWQVAKRLHQMELAITTTWPRVYHNDVELLEMMKPRVKIAGRSSQFEARSTTIPKALCIAALLAMGCERPVEKQVPHPEIGEGEET